ncbi:hypothetical protein HI914_07454 [Erysiphe necator]|nr:hypothetical protein HI914_07454 [Erysiphe necator]
MLATLPNLNIITIGLVLTLGFCSATKHEYNELPQHQGELKISSAQCGTMLHSKEDIYNSVNEGMAENLKIINQGFASTYLHTYHHRTNRKLTLPKPYYSHLIKSIVPYPVNRNDQVVFNSEGKLVNVVSHVLRKGNPGLRKDLQKWANWKYIDCKLNYETTNGIQQSIPQEEKRRKLHWGFKKS